MGFLFNSGRRKRDLVRQIQSLEQERDSLIDRNSSLERAVKDAKHRKDLAEDEIKHTVKMRDEALALERQKFEVKCERERDHAIAEVKDRYRDKLEKQLAKERDNIKDMYTEVLQRLPKVSVRQVDGRTEHVETRRDG